MRKGTLRPRPQEKKKWTRARTSSRRSRALAAQTKMRFVKDKFTVSYKFSYTILQAYYKYGAAYKY